MTKYGIRVRFDEHTWLWVLSPKATVCDAEPPKLLFDTYAEAEEYAESAWRLQDKQLNVIVEEVTE